MPEQQTNRPHRPSKEKKKHTGSNPKAFAFANPGKLQKQATRSHDVKEKRLHVPMLDRSPDPLIVVVVGPPGTGKTTLIKSLVKRYTKHTLTEIKGPITVVTGKKRRLTFIECANDINAMIDLAKVADIVLLLIDGNFGFEMETMEFLNVLASHGLPSNIFGILTHLDLFKSQSVLRTTKKRLKHRFWSELYQGAKLFYVSGVINGRYPDREIHNLSRFISVMKNPRPLKWKEEHYYLLVDRMVDLTNPTEVEQHRTMDRSVAVYGYLRGGKSFPAENARVHVPGVGDLSVLSVEALPDPCPTPAANAAAGKTRRRLGERQKLLYAPMSDVGGVLVDKDAVYVDMPSQTFDADALGERAGMGERLVVGLQQSVKVSKNERGLRLFSDGEALKGLNEEEDTGRQSRRPVQMLEEVNEIEDIDDDDANEGTDNEAYEDEEDEEYSEADGVGETDMSPRKWGRSLQNADEESNKAKGDITFADSDSDLGTLSQQSDIELDDGDIEEDAEENEGDLDGALRWKTNLSGNALKRFNSRIPNRTADLSRMLYDENLAPEEVIRKWGGEDFSPDVVIEDDEDDFFTKVNDDRKNTFDRSLPTYNYERLKQQWEDEEQLETLRRRFITSNLLDEKEEAGRNAESEEFEDFDVEGEDDEGDGAFEDLESGEVHGELQSGEWAKGSTANEADAIEAERAKNSRRKEELRLRFEEEDRDGLANDISGLGERAAEPEFGEDEWYDLQKAKLAKQAAVNQAEFEELDEIARAKVEGFRAGTYCKMVLAQMPYEFVKYFDPLLPIIVGGLSATEDRFGFLQVRIKRHRWHKKILKTNDPLIFSLGWRRFQTLPIYSISDSRTRNRMLKYTPEHMHCFGTFYGPLIAPNTGFCAMQTLSNKVPGFRIAATGVILSVDESTEIVKKLKLTGTPVRIFKNTAFIKDMFNSALEVAKFEGAGLRTVSGIRGQIKRALARPEGHFRATFEDKILMSDIVFLRAWYQVNPKKYYNPVTNLLMENKGEWVGMRLTGEVRREQGIKTPLPANSQYRKIERQTRHFNPLKVPKSILKELPFSSKLVTQKPQKRKTYLQKRAVVVGGEERKARDLIQKLNLLKKEKDAKRKEKKEEQRKIYMKKMAENEQLRRERERREKEEYWRREGKKRKGTQTSGGGGKRRKKGEGDD